MKGYLKGGINAWKSAGRSVDTVRSLAPEEFDRLYTEDKRILDVRNEPEWTEA